MNHTAISINPPAYVQGRDLTLPPGDWLLRRGVRVFFPRDPSWTPPEPDFKFDPSSVLDLTPLPAPIAVTPYRHTCECGCLLFGIENCPQCQWLAQLNEQKVA